jgi:hypothetical protein
MARVEPNFGRATARRGWRATDGLTRRRVSQLPRLSPKRRGAGFEMWRRTFVSIPRARRTTMEKGNAADR